MQNKNRSRKGYTLVELLIVIAIIGVMIAICVPIFRSRLEKSRRAVDLANARAIRAVLANIVNADEFNYRGAKHGNSKEIGFWVLVTRDPSSGPSSDYSGRTVYCCAETDVIIDGEPTKTAEGTRFHNQGVEDAMKAAGLNLDTLSVKASNTTVNGIGGWDWYLVEYGWNDVSEEYDFRIYSGSKKESASWAKHPNPTNIELYLNRQNS
ncbi:prepilin-type N-terminal cleavage/methylation domain-containing protein [[Clostridium] aminophilum]|uniref:Prepilin-type N-terminal cleavage/methylation domain-containing protein n=1 Tax=[Clostridium] aminophilum TaxID=1526 RepID=A0A1I0D137_9FIRM|nr:type II secretion system protein [[Clostridium] aminophilum]SET25456.1 prepilin-type N-terminal cleavage/methylation domain-containing protein [[Clostridium] aminophilum]